MFRKQFYESNSADWNDCIYIYKPFLEHRAPADKALKFRTIFKTYSRLEREIIFDKNFNMVLAEFHAKNGFEIC